MVSNSMLATLLQKQMAYEPERYPYYTFRHSEWASVSPDASSSRSTIAGDAPLESLRVITWNIDFMASQPRARMASALSSLEQLVHRIPSSCAVVIHLQEMMETRGSAYGQGANDLSQIKSAHWVQKRFKLTHADTSNWTAQYSQVTLIDRRLVIASVSWLRFVSEYQRDALWVDIHLDTTEPRFLRLCNVHLDSSCGSMRPVQWKALQQHLQNAEQGVVASIIAGDCNATQVRDRTAPQDHGFNDAYLELGGIEGHDVGATWGFQSVDAKRWGRQRLDKEVFWGNIRISSLERIGIGVQVEDERARKVLENDEELIFATDHYGLMGEFTVQGGLKTVVNCDA